MEPVEDSPKHSVHGLGRRLTLLSISLIGIIGTLVLLSGLSMELLSSVRAYVNGEGLWSKGQKDAVLYLTRYATSHAESDYQGYLAAIQVPLGDHAARLALSSPKFDEAGARRGFLQAKNHEADIDRMIWLFRHFHDYRYLREAIAIWEQGDGLISELDLLGLRLRALVSSPSPDAQAVSQTLREIYGVNDQLTPIEDKFSQTLGEAARRVQELLRIILAAGALLLIAGGCFTCVRLVRRIQESERKYYQLIESASDAIFLTDAVSGNIIESNRKGEEMLGSRLSEFVGQRLPLLPPVDLPMDSMSILLSPELRLPEGNQQMRLAAFDGRIIPVEVGANRLRLEGHNVLQSIVRDITLHKRAEQALRATRDTALEANRAKGLFLANMSHEIRTPMNGVLGMLTVLLSTELDRQQRDYVSVAKESAESLLVIINDILDFSRIDAGRLEVHPEPFDCLQIAERVLDLLRERAKQKGIALDFVIAQGLPAKLIADPVRVRQVLTNLINNAIKFTERGRVTLTVELRTDLRGEEWTRFEVTDTGIGIAPDAQCPLFEAFSQADSSITRRFGGTGLGLAISKQLVDLMGGHIGVESAAGEGSAFWFELPLTGRMRLEYAGAGPRNARVG